MFDTDLPFQKHSNTSFLAAESMEMNAGTLRATVLAYIKNNGFCSDEQMQIGLGMNPSTQRPRRIELVRRGLIEQKGETVTKSGRKAKIWGMAKVIE